jgi:cytochrome c biogenesis protein CcmG/thiol:disulfide interchange protein DsbE
VNEIPNAGRTAPSIASVGGRGRRRLILLVPLGVFLGLAALFFARLYTNADASLIPSPLIGRAAPAFDLPQLANLTNDRQQVPGLKSADLIGHVTLVNIWASWCIPCRQEHPILEELAKDTRFRLVGINYKDKDADARRFLGEFGNPYQAVGVDASGRGWTWLGAAPARAGSTLSASTAAARNRFI